MARWSGKKSYDNLLVQFYSKTISGTITDISYGELMNKPLSFPRPSRFDYVGGNISHRDNSSDGRFWEPRISSNTNAQHFGYSLNYFGSRAGNGKGYGFSLRCVAKSYDKIKL